MKTFLLYIALAGLTWNAQLQAAPYTLVDLEALEKEQAFREFFAHALDIRPSERTDYWKTMVQNMGEGQLKVLLSKNRLERDDFKQMEDLMSWSVLKTYEFYRLKRQAVGLRWFTQCLQENSQASSPCWQDIVDFWEKDRQEAEMAPRLLTLIAPYLPLSVADSQKPSERARSLVTPLFIMAPILQSPLAEFQCKKSEIQQIVWNELVSAYRSNAKDQSFRTLMRQIAHDDCWPAFSLKAHEMWRQGSDPFSLTLAFEILKSQNQVTPLEQDLYYLNYLLNSPARGETFNLAWNRVQELGLQPARREDLVRLLRNWNPLPGQLFSELDGLKRKTVARHLQRYFPEYLDFYAHTCIDYFGGKRRFPQGNPATYCRELFDLAGNEKGLLPDASIQAFKLTL